MTTTTEKPTEVIDVKFLELKYRRPGIIVTSEKKVMDIRAMYLGFASKISRPALRKLAEEIKERYPVDIGEGLKTELKKSPALRQRAKNHRTEHVTLLVIKHNLTVILCYLLNFDKAWLERNI